MNHICFDEIASIEMSKGGWFRRKHQSFVQSVR